MEHKFNYFANQIIVRGHLKQESFQIYKDTLVQRNKLNCQ